MTEHTRGNRGVMSCLCFLQSSGPSHFVRRPYGDLPNAGSPDRIGIFWDGWSAHRCSMGQESHCTISDTWKGRLSSNVKVSTLGNPLVDMLSFLILREGGRWIRKVVARIDLIGRHLREREELS